MVLLECIYGNYCSILSELLIVVLTFFAVFIALKQFKLYRKEQKNKTFIEFRQRFKADPINLKIFQYLLNKKDEQQNGNELKISEYEVYHFLGFYEELHKMLIDKQITIEDLVYYFGFYYLRAFEKAELFNLNMLKSDYWTRALDIYRIIFENQETVIKQIRLNFNYEENLSFFKL